MLAIDLDNTIICYDRLFAQIAAERALVAPEFTQGKQALRDIVRQSNDGEHAWQALQADVYGERIAEARPYPGALTFVREACERDVRIAIVSHKTMFAAARPAGANLRTAAMAWLCANGLVGPQTIAADDVYFESTRAAKIERLRSIGARIVIDDLIEVLADRDFPHGVRRWLFAPGPPFGAATPEAGGPSGESRLSPLETYASWSEMSRAFLVYAGASRC